MTESSFVYVTYIKTTADKLWTALTDPDFIRRYWLGADIEADWQPGGVWKITLADGRLADTGEIAEYEPPRRLAIRWRNEFMPEMKAEGWSLCTMEIEPLADAVKLTVRHSMPVAESKFIGAVSQGWPQILSNLKSVLEIGEPVTSPAA